MKFEDALVEYRKGKKIRRQSWVSSHYTETMTLYYTCVIADDWEVIEESKPPRLMAPCVFKYRTSEMYGLSDILFACEADAKELYDVVQWPALPDANGFYSVPQE